MTMPTHGWKAAHRPMLAPHSQFYEGRFGRMFRKLPAWEPRGRTEEDKEKFIAELAVNSFEAAGPNAELDNTKIPSAYTYFGQFVDHDITFDTTSSMEKQNDPDRLHNFRTPRFDLDNIYGRGPADQPYLYQDPEINPGQNDSNKLLIGRQTTEPPTGEEDLPRNSEGIALIGDPRNDENIIVSQLQLALLKFHNRMVDRARERFDDPGDVLREAQRLTRWHYQWVVVHDFLKRICGKQLVDGLLRRTGVGGKPYLQFYRPKHHAYIPVEFSVAAYRIGHSMVRAVYHLNDRLTEIREGRPLPIFGPEDTEGTLQNLRGFRPLPAVWTIQWDRFVEHQRSKPQPSRRIDTKLAAPLMTLSASVVGPVPVDDARRSLAFRNLLREAEEQHRGEQLGDVGATIVAEVFVGLLAEDPLSFYSVRPHWTPELESAGKEFELADLLRHAGAPMTRAEVEALLAPR